MKSFCLSISSGFMFLILPSLVRADVPDLAPISTLVQRIHQAPTASETVAAYVHAAAIAGGDVSIRQAYVVRMVELQQPEMAEAQARELVDRSGDGLPWAVLGFVEAQRGHLDTALSDVSKAAQRSPNDEFVMETAGQLLAWYDEKVDLTTQQEATKKDVDLIRSRLSARRTFSQAYDDAYGLLLSSDPQVDPEAVDPEQLNRVLAARRGSFMITGAPSAVSSPLAVFYAAPYAMFPSYGYGYQPWAPPVYYGYGLYNRSISTRLPFPFPAVDPGTRYLRLAGLSNSGFALVNNDGTFIYQQNPGTVFLDGGLYGGATTYYYAPFSYGLPYIANQPARPRFVRGPGRPGAGIGIGNRFPWRGGGVGTLPAPGRGAGVPVMPGRGFGRRGF